MKLNTVNLVKTNTFKPSLKVGNKPQQAPTSFGMAKFQDKEDAMQRYAEYNKEGFILNQGKEKTESLMSAIEKNIPEYKIIEKIDDIKHPAILKATLLHQKDNFTLLDVANREENTEVAHKIIDIVENQDEDFQKEFLSIIQEGSNNTQLDYAIDNESYEIVDRLLKLTAKVDPKSIVYKTFPVNIATRDEFVEVAETIAFNEDISKKDTFRFINNNNYQINLLGPLRAFVIENAIH